MQTTSIKDPYQLVCQAFERNEVQELLLGEKGYDYKMDYRNNLTSPEEKTDIDQIHYHLIKYYLAHNKNPDIPKKITAALLNMPESHWTIRLLSDVITHQTLIANRQQQNLNLNLECLAHHLKLIISKHRTELMQEKLFGGSGLDRGMYENLERGSEVCVKFGGPSYIEVNPTANDHFEAETTFTLTLPNKLINLNKELNLIPLHPSKIILKGTPIPKANGFVAAEDSSWIYTMERQKQPTAEIQFICMVNQLYCRRIKLLKLIDDFGLKAQLDTIIWMEKSNQSLNISSEVLQKIAEMQIPYNIEIRLMEDVDCKK